MLFTLVFKLLTLFFFQGSSETLTQVSLCYISVSSVFGYREVGKWENSFPTFLICFESEMGNGKPLFLFPFPFSFLHLSFTLSFSHFFILICLIRDKVHIVLSFVDSD